MKLFTAEHLKQQLDDYVLLLPKVRLVRSKGQLGVISARQEGSALASGSILVFLDSHVECATGM
jgi:polypeptide N-acetylgalactosaminyltransferase